MKQLHKTTLVGFTLLSFFVILNSINDVDASRNSKISTPATMTTQLNEYSNYVHFQPEWKSYPRNIIVDVSTTWERQIISGSGEKEDISKHGAKQRQNSLQYVNSKPVVAVQYDYRDCQSQWFHYAKTGLDFIGNHLESFGKNKQIPNSAYSNEAQKQKLRDGFAQFIPICTSKKTTTYEYTISINDDTLGFDAYFVPSNSEQENYFSQYENFEHYEQEGCTVNNHQKFSGTCSVDRNAGLLIVIPDELSRPMTEISVKLTEKNNHADLQ